MSSAAVVIGDLRVNRLTSELKPDFSDMRKTLLGRHVLNSFAMEKWKFGIPAMEPCTIVWQWKTEKTRRERVPGLPLKALLGPGWF